MSVSRRVIHHGLYFAVLGPLIGVLFLVLYIFFAKEPLVLLRRIQVLPLFLLLSITTGVIPALLTGVMVACLPEKIGSQKKLSLSGWWHRWRRYHRDLLCSYCTY
ncbi:inner membrane protein [Escherichia coli]|nr:inner membrane protein [Escherichia coli]